MEKENIDEMLTILTSMIIEYLHQEEGEETE